MKSCSTSPNRKRVLHRDLNLNPVGSSILNDFIELIMSNRSADYDIAKIQVNRERLPTVRRLTLH